MINMLYNPVSWKCEFQCGNIDNDLYIDNRRESTDRKGLILCMTNVGYRFCINLII